MSFGFRNSLSLILGLVLHSMTYAAPFEPKIDFSLTEKWRWHELEALNDYLLYQAVEDVQGNLIFTSKEFLVIYDGYTISEVPYPDTEPDFVTYQLFYSNNGYIYLNTARGVFAYHEGEWTKKIDFFNTSTDIRKIFARSAFGLEVVALPSGIYRIDGTEFTRIDEIEGTYSSVSFDHKNRLWCTASQTNEIVHFQFDRDQLALPIQSEILDIGYGTLVFPWLIASPESDEIWTTNWQPNLPAYRYDEESNAWIPSDLRRFSGDNGHISGYHINESDMIIFSKNGTLVKRQDEWHSFEYPDFDFPTNHPFYLLRSNGDLVLGGRGEKIYQISYRSEEQDSYLGLHFQCDVGSKTRWYISVEGYIIEQDTIYDTWIRHDENVIDTPLVILKSEDDTIWAAGAHRGVAAVCYYNGRSWTRETLPQLNRFISHLSARLLPDGRLIFGSGEDNPVAENGGLVIYKKVSSSYQKEYISPPNVPKRPIAFAIDKDHQLWMGGPTLSKTNTSLTAPLVISPEFSSEIWVDHITDDHKGNIWAAQWDRGLFEFDGEEWIQHRNVKEIASSRVSFLMKDEFRENNLWIGTDRGISRYDGVRWYPQALPQELRLIRESGTLKQSSDGAIWVNLATRSWFFRKNTGFYLTKSLSENFKTVRYQLDESPPMVSIDSNIPKTTSPANVFIEWSGIDKWSKTPSSKLKYSYKLNHEEWSDFEEGNSRVFLDLPKGEHQFSVRALDLDGNISQQIATTDFLVIPPVWQRTWFIALAILTFLIIVFLIYLLFRQRIRHIIQLDEFKLQFFTNISHELRTPLTVILGPLESQLAKLPPDWDKKPLEIAYKNARKTLSLIDQILDFRRAETGNIKINLARSDLVETIREVFHLIKPLADDRSQMIELECDTDACFVWYDAEKIERILNNLISNAIKYTQKHGKISVKIRLVDFDESVTAEIVVEDNGSGIPSGKIDNIFDVFYRAGNVPNTKVRGFGIGLTYTKNLVEACDGTISVDSPIANVNGKRQGTRFTVSLPFSKTHFGHYDEAHELDEEIQADELDDSNSDEQLSNEGERSLILIAEDDQEIREFLASELREDYKVSTAKDGAIAMKIALKRIPDLILTDVMMPEIDGKELCRQIKADLHTSHIPVIMLTALKSDRHELEGLEIGADDYLSKPVKLSILKQRIHNILESRRRLHDLYSEQKENATVVSQEITTNPLDEAFMNKAVTIIENHIEDPLFNVEAFASKMHMSRMTLYRKFKAITGDSPSIFIRSIRMNKAAALLATGEYNISEISDLVGITDLSSFSTSFKKHFKVSPSQYLAKRS